MTKRKDSRLKRPDEFLAKVRAILNTPPPPGTEKRKRKAIRKRKDQ